MVRIDPSSERVGSGCIALRGLRLLGVPAPDPSTAVGYSVEVETMAAFSLCLATQVAPE